MELVRAFLFAIRLRLCESIDIWCFQNSFLFKLVWSYISIIFLWYCKRLACNFSISIIFSNSWLFVPGDFKISRWSLDLDFIGFDSRNSIFLWILHLLLCTVAVFSRHPNLLLLNNSINSSVDSQRTHSINNNFLLQCD